MVYTRFPQTPRALHTTQIRIRGGYNRTAVGKAKKKERKKETLSNNDYIVLKASTVVLRPWMTQEVMYARLCVSVCM